MHGRVKDFSAGPRRSFDAATPLASPAGVCAPFGGGQAWRTRWRLGAALSQALILWCLLSRTLAAAPPNVVLIVADDLGWGDVGFHGGPAPTPCLEQLRARGVEMTQHYSAPLCTPTRVSLLTGRYWSRFGVTDPQNEPSLPRGTATLASLLKRGGYETCITGKWHLGSTPEWGPNHFGFDHSYGSLAGGVGPYYHAYKHGPFSRTWHRNEKLIDETGHVTDLIAAEAIAWVRGRSARPFFLYVPFTAVHLPLKEPDEWLERARPFAQDELSLHYAASVMHLDDAVSKILAAAAAGRRPEDTLVIFTSDNGASRSENNDPKYSGGPYPGGAVPGRNAPWRGKKAELYEGGVRVPTLVSWPGRLPPRAFDQPAIVADWTPTICAAAGVAPEPAQTWDGVNLLAALESDAPIARQQPLYWLGPERASRAVRSGSWKLIVHDASARQAIELFDLGVDPGETRNVAAEHPDVVRDLQQELARAEQLDRRALAALRADR